MLYNVLKRLGFLCYTKSFYKGVISMPGSVKDFGTLGTYNFVYGNDAKSIARDIAVRGELETGDNNIPFVFTHTKGMRYGTDDGVNKAKRLGQLGIWARETMREVQKGESGSRITFGGKTADEGFDTISNALRYMLR